MLTVEDLQARIAPMFPGSMGVQVLEASTEKVVASLLVRPEHSTVNNNCHGGAFMAFADAVGALGTIMNLPPRTWTTTIESKTNFLAPAAVGTRIRAESIPLHRGKTTQLWQTMIRNEAGKLCAVVTQTQMVLPE